MKKQKTALISILGIFVVAIGIFSVCRLSGVPMLLRTRLHLEGGSSSGSRAEFHIENAFDGADGQVNNCIFSGTIADIKQYRALYSYDGVAYDQDCWILYVKPEKTYSGDIKQDADTVRILYTYPVGTVCDHSVSVLPEKEYIFCTWKIDEQYFRYCEKVADNLSYTKNPALKEADFIMGSAWAYLFPIENGNVYLYHEYLDGFADAQKNILAADAVRTDLLTSENALTSGDFVAVKQDYFEKILTELIAWYAK